MNQRQYKKLFETREIPKPTEEEYKKFFGELEKDVKYMESLNEMQSL